MNKNDKKMLIIFVLVCIIFLFIITGTALSISNSNEKNYKVANEYLDEGKYLEAKNLFLKLGDYKDSKQKEEEAQKKVQHMAENAKLYDEAQNEYTQGNYKSALENFEKIQDSVDVQDKIKEIKYYLAIQYYDNDDYDRSKQLFEELKEYKDIDSYLEKILEEYKSIDSYLDEIELKKLYQLKEDIYKKACTLLNEKKYKEAIDYFNEILDYKDSEKKVKECENEQQKRLTTISSGVNQYFAITNEGKVICTDRRYEFKNEKNGFEDWNNIISISYLDNMVIGLKEDGKAILEGHRNDENGNDICDANITEWENLIQIESGQQHVVGLTNDGKVLTSGLDKYTENGNKLTEVASWTNIQYIATGWSHIVGLDSNGKIHIAGENRESQMKEIEQNNNWNDIIAISAGGGSKEKAGHGHTVGLQKDGTVVAVGYNECGQCEVDDWTDIVAISAGDWHTVGLRKDGTVVSTKPTKDQIKKENLSSDSACRVDNWTDIVAISAGRGFTIGLKSDGSVVYTGKEYPGEKNWNDIKIYKNWDSVINQTNK